MTSDSAVVSLRQPDALEDPLTIILRSGARRLLVQAIETEAEAFLATLDRRLITPSPNFQHGSDQQLPPALRALAASHLEAEQLLLSFRK